MKASPARRSRVLGEEGGFDFSTGVLTFRDRSLPRQTIHGGPQADSRLALEAFLAAVRAEAPLPPPITLAEARAATLIGLLARKAVDERRVVAIEELRARRLRTRSASMDRIKREVLKLSWRAEDSTEIRYARRSRTMTEARRPASRRRPPGLTFV